MFTTYNKQLKSYTQDPATAPLETQQRYLFDAGSLPAQPVYLVGRVDAAVDVLRHARVSPTVMPGRLPAGERTSRVRPRRSVAWMRAASSRGPIPIQSFAPMRSPWRADSSRTASRRWIASR